MPVERMWDTFDCDDNLACSATNGLPCLIEDQIISQAQYDYCIDGGWTQDAWVNYAERITELLQYCPLREKILEVLIVNHPPFVDSAAERY